MVAGEALPSQLIYAANIVLFFSKNFVNSLRVMTLNKSRYVKNLRISELRLNKAFQQEDV
jgi:hypothetical protein